MAQRSQEPKRSTKFIQLSVLRKTLSQLLDQPLQEEALHLLDEYVASRANLGETTIIALDDLYPIFERLVKESKDDYLQPLLVLQSLDELSQAQKQSHL